MFNYFVGTTAELDRIVKLDEASRFGVSSAIEVNGPGKGIVVVNVPCELVSKAVT